MTHHSNYHSQVQDWPNPKLCQHRVTKVTGVGKFCWQCGVCLDKKPWRGREPTGRPQVSALKP